MDYFRTGETLSVDFRIEMLKKLKHAVKKHEKSITRALNKDLSRHSTESYFCDIGTMGSDPEIS